MKTTTYPLFTLALFFFFPFGLLQSQEDKRSVDPFDAIQIQGHYDVLLTRGKEGTLKLSGKSTDLKQVETFVKNNILIIKQSKELWSLSDWTSGRVSIEIPVERINEVILNGSGEIRSKHTLSTTSFKTKLSGSGDIDLTVEAERVKGIVTGSGDLRLSGKAQETYFEVTGSGDIKAKNLKSNVCSGRITGSGSINIYAKVEMDSYITGSGHINCYGKPPFHKTKVTGSGDVYFKD